MAIIGNRVLTLADMAKRFEPGGGHAQVVEILSETNEILDDAMWKEANAPTHHQTTTRNGLPEAFWRALNRGVPKSKSTMTQVTDTMGSLEVYAETDKDLVDLAGGTAEARLVEERAFIESMNQTMAKSIFYGNHKADTREFNGLAMRYSTRDKAKADSAKNVIDMGGTAVRGQTSVYLACWSENTLHMIYPKGSKAGLSINDKGQVTVMDDTDERGQYEAYRTHFAWKAGLSLRDWRYVVRIANIEAAALAAIIKDGAATAASQMLIRAMMQAYDLIPNVRAGKMAWYMNRTPKLMLSVMAMEKANVNLTIEKFEGKPVTSFMGIPIRIVDAIMNTEEVVAA